MKCVLKQLPSGTREGEILLYLEKLKTRTRDFASDGFIRESLEKINYRGPGFDVTVQNLSGHLRAAILILKSKIDLFCT